MLKTVSSLKEEAHQLEEEAQHLEMEGLGKVEVLVAGSEVEGSYGLLRGAIAYSSVSSAPPPLRKPTTFCPPLSPICPLRNLQVSHPKSPILQQGWQNRHWKLLLQLPPWLQRKLSPPTCSPFAFNLGASKECTDGRLRVTKRDHQPHGLQSAHMCTGYTWGWGWCVPLVANCSSTQTYSGTTRKVNLICK